MYGRWQEMPYMLNLQNIWHHLTMKATFHLLTHSTQIFKICWQHMPAINLMIGDDPRLVFILGMDREKVAAGIAQKYKDLISFLPDFAKTSAGVNPIEGLYFGYSYLEKFIQLTFRIPGLDGDAAINK